jgi:geranylgeranyl pyrophosphate synthase
MFCDRASLTSGTKRRRIAKGTPRLVSLLCLGNFENLSDFQIVALDAACRFASSLGLAFQIRDDILDVIGTKEEMGKSVGTDSAKNTFVRLYGLEKCEELVQRYTQYALDALTVFEDTEYISTLAKSLTTRRT